MRVVAILGAGNGGCAAAADLRHSGHRVRLWNRSAETLSPLNGIGGIRYEGALGEGLARPEAITDDLGAALHGADVALVCLPAVAHAELARELVQVGATLPIVLHPGHLCGSLHLAATIEREGGKVPPIAELSTLAYVARKPAPSTVRITARAARVWAACLPGANDALAAARELYVQAEAAPDVLATGLADVNLVLHPPGAILGAAWVEASGGDFRFYAEGTTQGVARVIEALDAERLAVARAFGHELPPLIEEMAAIGTVEPAAAARNDLRGAISGAEANLSIMAPRSLADRYYLEDLGFGLVPLEALAAVAGLEVPVAASLRRLGEVLTGRDLAAEGLSAGPLGITGLDRARLLERVRSPLSPVARIRG